MPYIGKSPTQAVRQKYQYTATAGQTTFSGSDANSLTLAYTDENYIDVTQNGVMLKGGGNDYTATTGTSVVLATGASVSDVIEIIVYDVFAVADHVKKSGDIMTGSLDLNGTELVLDADGDSSITSDTDDRVDIKVGGSDIVHVTSSGLGIGETSPARGLTIHKEGNHLQLTTDASGTTAGNGTDLKVDASSSDFQLLNYESAKISLFTSGLERLTIDANGHVTMPSQPAFHVINGSDNGNIATNNTEITVNFSTESFDVNADFNTTNFTFTAPVTGKYQFNVSLSVSQIDTAATQYLIRLNTSNRNYHLAIDPEFGSDTLFPFSISALADMDASDTAIVTIAQDGGTAQTDVRADPGSHFSGFLAC